jgi:hypothetical protein|nr:MAG TPA_asm: hypothetical protein [Bacteriophage sp.]
MDFMITSVDDVSRQVHYSINKVGSKYAVRAYNDKNGRSVSRTFDELMEAYKVFEKIVSWVVFGLYADKDRMDFIETGTME